MFLIHEDSKLCIPSPTPEYFGLKTLRITDIFIFQIYNKFKRIILLKKSSEIDGLTLTGPKMKTYKNISGPLRNPEHLEQSMSP